MTVEVTGVDHLYIAVSDLERSEAFYDPVMERLGFKKGTRPIAGEPHVHYYNRVMQLTLRPARSPGAHDPYRAGAVHHLCLTVADRAAVDRVYAELRALGIEASEPALYEYRADYYATFFADPDGVRLEVVCDTAMRRVLRGRFDELEGFVDPLSRLADAPPSPSAGSLVAAIPAELPDELVEILARSADARVERIVSRGHASPEGFWYDQAERELVVLVSGAARLELEGDDAPLEMRPGDWVMLEAHRRHRVAWTAPGVDTVWLAVFLRA